MPVYRYKGVAAGNRAVSASIDADSLRSARSKLRAEGIFPTEILEGKVRSETSELLHKLQLPQLRRIPDLDLAMFSSQLATLVAAGLPLVQALAALTEQVERERFKTVIGRVRESVNEGTSLAEALGLFPHVFDELYCSMVRAGESSGALAPVLQRLAEYVENRMVLRNQLINAMIYPGADAVLQRRRRGRPAREGHPEHHRDAEGHEAGAAAADPGGGRALRRS